MVGNWLMITARLGKAGRSEGRTGPQRKRKTNKGWRVDERANNRNTAVNKMTIKEDDFMSGMNLRSQLLEIGGFS
jgi:hypothetical protein